MMRVGFVVHSMQVAGAERLVIQTIQRLADRLEPTVFCLDAIGTLGEQLQRDGVPVECLQRRPGGIDWRVSHQLARECRQRDIEVLHAHQYTPFFYAALARLRGACRTRLVMTEHGRHWPDVVSAKRRWINRLLLARLAHRVNACSAFSAQALARNDGFPRQSIQVIRNGIDLQGFRPSRGPGPPDLAPLAGRRLLGMVARFHEIKNHGLLLDGLALLAETRDDVDLLLVGDGPLREHLERRTAELGLTDRVHFLGVRDDVAAILSRLDVFVLTSRCEAAPLTVLEAMASGVPVVATRVGGVPEMIRDQVDGLLVDPDRPDELALAIAHTLDDPAATDARVAHARQRVLADYTIEETVERYWESYQAG